MLPRHIRYHRARCDRLGNNPPLLLIAPPSAADNARYFRVAPNNLRVVTNVDHNVHTILDPKNRDRALLAVTQLCGVKAPLTFSGLDEPDDLVVLLFLLLSQRKKKKKKKKKNNCLWI